MEGFDHQHQQPLEESSDMQSMIEPAFPTVQIHVPGPPRRMEGVAHRSRIDRDSTDEAFAKFIFSSGIKYSIVDDFYFKNMMRSLNLTYKTPCHKTLLLSFLDKHYERHFTNSKKSLLAESILVMIDVKDANATLCVLYSANGKLGFIGIFKKSDNAEELFQRCKILANENFNTKIYAVYTNNETFSTQENVMILKDYSQLATQLAETIIPDYIIFDVNRVMEHFRHHEHLLIKYGGSQLKMIESSTRREFLSNFLNNHGPMQKCLTMEKTEPPPDFYNDFFGSEYIKGVKTVMDVSQQVLDSLQKKTLDLNYNVADVLEDWMNFQVPEAFKETVHQFRKGLFEPVSYAANILHPKYRGLHLSNIQKDTVDEFFLQNLIVEGLDSFQNLLHKECIFESLLAKEISSPMTFWRMAQRKHSNLSEFATKLLNIPASFVKIEMLLNNWISSHQEFDELVSIKTGKLIHFYLDLNYKITSEANDE